MRKDLKPIIETVARNLKKALNEQNISVNKQKKIYNRTMERVVYRVNEAVANESYNFPEDNGDPRIEELYNLILDNGGSMDVSEYGIRWSYWNDNDTTHYDDDAYTDDVTELSISTDINGVRCVFVTINDKDTFNIENAPYEDSEEFIDYVVSSVI